MNGERKEDVCEKKKFLAHRIIGSLSNVVEKYYREILGNLGSTAFPCFVIENIEDATTEVLKVTKTVADTF